MSLYKQACVLCNLKILVNIFRFAILFISYYFYLSMVKILIYHISYYFYKYGEIFDLSSFFVCDIIRYLIFFCGVIT